MVMGNGLATPVLKPPCCNRGMTQATRIYRRSGKGTDWAALMLGAGLGAKGGWRVRCAQESSA